MPNFSVLLAYEQFSAQNGTSIYARSDAVCTVHHLTICIRTNKMHKILVIRLYFLLDALHVSGYISPSSGATFISCTSHLVYADTIRPAVVWLYVEHLIENKV